MMDRGFFYVYDKLCGFSVNKCVYKYKNRQYYRRDINHIFESHQLVHMVYNCVGTLN